MTKAAHSTRQCVVCNDSADVMSVLELTVTDRRCTR